MGGLERGRDDPQAIDLRRFERVDGGQDQALEPARAAAIAMDRMRGVGMSSPLSESSPARANLSKSVDGTCDVAASTPAALLPLSRCLGNMQYGRPMSGGDSDPTGDAG